jgi:hypothetical protein
MVAQAKAASPNVVNGINVDDLFALIDGVKRDVAKAKTNWHVATSWRGQTRSRSQVDGFTIGGEQVAGETGGESQGYFCSRQKLVFGGCGVT